MSIIIGLQYEFGMYIFILLVIHISLYFNFRSNSKESKYINIKRIIGQNTSQNLPLQPVSSKGNLQVVGCSGKF